MAKLSTLICFLLVLLVFTCDEKMFLPAEGRDCHNAWTCKGEQRCRDDCQRRYNGMGLCDLYTGPFVPKQCFCAYKC